MKQNKIISTFDIFSIGVGPSSSHTVGPMKAAYQFIMHLPADKKITRIQVILHGSLAHTGLGHLTHQAILMGLEGHQPHCIDPQIIHQRTLEIIQHKQLQLPTKQSIPFDFNRDLIFDKKIVLDYHTNGMQFFAWDETQQLCTHQIYYSVGGGFIEQPDDHNTEKNLSATTIPFPFHTAEELISLCEKNRVKVICCVLK